MVRRSQRLFGDQATRVDRPILGVRGYATISAAGERDRDVLPALRDRPGDEAVSCAALAEHGSGQRARNLPALSFYASVSVH